MYGSHVPTQVGGGRWAGWGARQQESSSTTPPGWENEVAGVCVKGYVNDFTVNVRFDVEILFMINLSFFLSRLMVYHC